MQASLTPNGPGILATAGTTTTRVDTDPGYLSGGLYWVNTGSAGAVSGLGASSSIASGGTASLGVTFATTASGDFTGSSVAVGLTLDGAATSGLRRRSR